MLGEPGVSAKGSSVSVINRLEDRAASIGSSTSNFLTSLCLVTYLQFVAPCNGLRNMFHYTSWRYRSEEIMNVACNILHHVKPPSPTQRIQHW